MGGATSSRAPFARLRRAILALLVASVAGVAGLYLLGRRSGPEPVEWRPDAPAAQGAAAPGSDPLAESEGFEYERRVGERSALRLRGERFTRQRDEVIHLEGVELELTREDGKVYEIRSDRAVYDTNDGGAELTGAVRLSGGRGFGITAERLDLLDGGRVVVSRGPVGLELGPGLTGRAGGLRFDAESDRFHLRGRVHAAGRRDPQSPPLALDAEEVLVDRQHQVVRATGDALLVMGADRLRARELELAFDEQDGSPRRAVARRDVVGGISTISAGSDASGEAATESSPGRVRFESAMAALDFAPGTNRPEALDLEGTPAKLSFHHPRDGIRHLQAPSVVALFADGRPREAAASGGVVVREPGRGPGRGAREVRGDDARGSFGSDGELTKVAILGHVELQSQELTARGERADLDAASGEAVLVGGKEPAYARSTRGELWAPRIELAREHGSARASRGVRASLDGEAAGLRLGPESRGTQREPIRVRSREATWDDEKSTWAFLGDVEAVQGESLLFADELTGTATGGEATARGAVRTIWKDTRPDAPTATTSVSAASVVYREQQGEIEYLGGVSVRQEQRELESDRLRIELDAEQRAKRMEANGAVRLADRATGRVVTGASALHDLEAETIVIAGEPVVLTEESGATIRGRRLLYDLEHGTAQMLAEEDPA